MSARRHFAVFTTASLPWMTGTSINPLFRAAYLAKDGSRDVTLLIPWLSLRDQELVYPNKVVFGSPLEQEGYVRRWIEERVDFRPSFSIKFYPAKFSKEMRSILPVGDITECIPDEAADIAVLEEPEHLNWYHHGRRWKNKFRRVIGVIHTNYLAYVRREKNGQVIACCLRYANTWVTRIYCHKIIRLSGATQDLPKSVVCNVHGVNPKFLEVGRLKLKQLQNGEAAFTKGAYYIGKMVWSKGYREVSLGASLNAYSNLGVLAAVTWQVLFVSVPMIVLAIRLQRYYLASAKELMRINGTTKSALANHLGESIAGAITIRAFEEEDRFFTKNLDLVDKNASPYFYNFASTEWLIQRLEIMSAAVLSFSAFVMALLPQGTFSPGFVGMALSYGLSLNMSFVFSIQNQCNLANQIISVERVNQYMDIQSEAAEVVEENRPSPDWPQDGNVELKDLKIRYRKDAPLVLHGITCRFEGGNKIGIVGRTGSGKTTLIGALFRLVEPSEGKIIIDSVDISTIGLHDLRSRLGIIPQDPTLFQGTVRYNLDPLGQFSDQQIWEVLDKCQLLEAVQEKEQGLDSHVVEDGSNWSMGQRQLFCLGRALLRRCRILVLDEATASIDNATDAVLQKTIRSEFKYCTVITVAHRIPTVMDCDMVLAMSDGKVVEYDKPTKLMETEGSLFHKLVNEYWSYTSNGNI